MCFFQQGLEFLVAAVDDILFLEIGGELHRKAGNTGDAAHQVTAGAPGVPAAADRAVGYMDHIADRAPDNALGSCIGTATGAHDTRNGFFVGFDAGAAGALVIGAKVRSALLPGLLGISCQGLSDQGLGGFLGDAFYFSYLV